MKKIYWETILELTARIYVFIFLNLYGCAKLFGGQFYTSKSIPERVLESTIDEISNFDLAWSFMGRSFGYMAFIGISEILGAWLLIFNRTKILGALVLLIILVNVIVFDIFFLDAYGALASAIIYTLLIILILWINRNTLLRAIKIIVFKQGENRQKLSFITLIIITLLMAILFGLDQSIVNFLGHGKG